MPHLSLNLLGSPRILLEDRPLEVDTRKATALLIYLLVSGEMPTRERLMTLLWPDNDASGARAALRRTLSVLNKALGGQGLEIRREAVGLSPQLDAWVDVVEFRRLLERTRQHAHSKNEVCRACLPSLQSAVELYRDDFLTGFGLRDSPNFDEWQFFQADGLRRELASALQRLSQGLAQEGDYEQALTYARRWLALDPLLEDAHRQLILLYAWAGQRNAALRQYRECVRILDQELGVAPLEETTALYTTVLEHHTPPAPAPSQAMDSQPPAGPLEPAPSPAGFPLVGREGALNHLEEVYQTQAGRGFWVVLRGELGIGKTRLAEELIAWASQRGAALLSARCYEGEANLTYAPILAALTPSLAQPGALQGINDSLLGELSRLLPDLRSQLPHLPEPPALDNPGAQSRFFESLRQVLLHRLAGPQPGLLFVDDLQWIDSASLDLLTYFVRRLSQSPVLVLTTFRPEAGSASERIQTFLTEMQRAGKAESIQLERLGVAEMEALIASARQRGLEVPAHFHQTLFAETEGLPFFAVEYLESILKETASPTTAGLPHSVRDVLRTRLAAVGEAEAQLLTTAAVIGRSFDFNTLAAASGRSELETLAGLEKLVAQGLISEQNPADADIRYDFTHDKLRSLVYEDTGLTRRRLLHRRVAEHLAGQRRTPRDPSPIDSVIALHYQLAGQDSLAAEAFKSAGDYARSLYAHREAVAHYQAALALGHAPAAPVQAALGDLFTLLGDYEHAIAAYETAAALGLPTDLGDLERKLGGLAGRRGEWKLAVSHYQAALEAYSPATSPAALSALYGDWSQAVHHQGDPQQAESLAQQALQLAEQANDPVALAQAHNLLGILSRSQANLTAARSHLERSLELARASQDASAQAAALNNLAQATAEQGDYEVAIHLTQQALELAVRQGDRHHEAALYNNLADLLYAAHRSNDAMELLKKAVVIFAEIGIQGGLPRPEIWMLTEW